MQIQYDHEVIISFKYWLDNYLLQREAYQVKTGYYYPQPTKIGSDYVYSAPAAQFVYDSDITGASIPSGVTINGSWLNRGESGLKIDFINGRVYTQAQNAIITGEYTQKDFNIYLANEYEDSLLWLDEAYNGKDIFSVESGSTPGRYVAPCALISLGNDKNKPWAIGGTDETTIPFSVMLVTDDYYKAVGAKSILRDSSQNCLYRFPVTGEPFTIYGDLKESGFNYSALTSGLGSNRLLYIDNVRTFPIKKEINQRRDFYVFLVEMDIKDYRLT